MHALLLFQLLIALYSPPPNCIHGSFCLDNFCYVQVSVVIVLILWESITVHTKLVVLPSTLHLTI